jgi:hypothetical protein
MFNFNFNFTTSSFWDKSVSTEEFNKSVNELYNKYKGNSYEMIEEINKMPNSALRSMLLEFNVFSSTKFKKD